MRNGKDKYFIKLLIAFIIYYFISCYIPAFFNSRILNLIVKDVILMLSLLLLYYKDIKSDWNKFKRSNGKWKVIAWVIVIYIIIVGINAIVNKYYPKLLIVNESDKNNNAIKNLYEISKCYAIFKALIFTAIAEPILYSLSIKKIIHNNIIFILLSSLIYTYFNYLFTGLSNIDIIGAIVIRFVPYCLYNFAYTKSNNIIYLMGINFIINMVAVLILLLG